jgi:hypothetical protein
VSPIVKAADLAGKIAVHERHEASELGGVVDGQQRVPVVRKHHNGMDTDREQGLRAAHNP